MVEWFFLFRASRAVRVSAKVPRLFTKGGPYFSSRLRVDIIMAHPSVSGSGHPAFLYIIDPPISIPEPHKTNCIKCLEGAF